MENALTRAAYSFSEMLTDFERIGDHALNISNEILKITMKEIV